MSDSSKQHNAAKLASLLETANRCLVRQLRLLSNAHPASTGSAEAIFETMLQSLEAMAEAQELLTDEPKRQLSVRGCGVKGDDLELPAAGCQPHWEFDQEATPLLRAKKLRK